MFNPWLNEVYNFLEDYIGVYEYADDVDICDDLGIDGDDFDELIYNFSKDYKIDVSEYLWYFHCSEEGFSIGSLFYKSPDRRVKRIPITPLLLAECLSRKEWIVKYPQHDLPKYRYDIWIGNGVLIILLIITIILVIGKLY